MIRDHLLRTGFELKHFKWVPHTPTGDQKRSRIEISRELLNMLRTAGHNSWNYFVTGDEGWVYFGTDHETMWLEHGESEQYEGRK
jgi:hypothetical protein